MTDQLKCQPIKPATLTFWIKGTSPLIQHAWSEKGLTMLRMTATERRKQPKVARDPQGEAMNAAYRTPDGQFGLPLLAFKASLIGAAHKDIGLEKTLVRKSLFVSGSGTNAVVPMEHSEPVIREDIVRIGANQTDIRYRPMFEEWRVKITAQVDTAALSQQDIINLVNRAGFSVGIGEWRPEKGGEFGRFEFDTSEPMETVG